MFAMNMDLDKDSPGITKCVGIRVCVDINERKYTAAPCPTPHANTSAMRNAYTNV